MHVFAVRLNCVLLIESVGVEAATLAELLIVTVCGGLDKPGLCGAKISCGGLTLSPAIACPEPFRGALTPVAFEEEIDSEASLPPDAIGVKVTCMVQLFPVVNVVPLAVGQVVAPMAK